MSYLDHTHTVEDKRAVILLSGGLDSTVAAALAKRMGWQLWALGINYGQLHYLELSFAPRIASHLKLECYQESQVDLRFLKSPLVDGTELPIRTLEEIRADQKTSPANLPGRNLIFLSIAAAWARSLGIQHVMIGATLEDQVGFPDCRPEFFESASKALGVHVVAPLVSCRKLDVVDMATKWTEVPISMTSSCYEPTNRGACGRCDPCVIRLDAFSQLGIEDPIPYRWRP